VYVILHSCGPSSKEVTVLPDLPVEGWQLHAGQTLSLQVEVVPRHGGILCSLLIFEFPGQTLPTSS
jgi:hypothetical protein